MDMGDTITQMEIGLKEKSKKIKKIDMEWNT